MSISLARRVAFIILLTAVPAISFAQTTPTDFKSLANMLIKIITMATSVVITLAFVYYLWSIATVFQDSGSAKGWEALRTRALWGIIILFVIFSIGGILHVLSVTFFQWQGGIDTSKIPT
ncbi:MAG TPA: hypothetical protein VN495_00350 [Candidatus Paceibacterota bacterium]|nr:hypothetical protein [Candidatus Paceibacterota bacterium]